MSHAANFIDPAVLAAVDNLELRARLAVEGFLNGLHRSPHRGFSVEFTDYRHYYQGDDTRHIDWKLYGRSDKLYIKQFEDETNSRCMIVLDASASMAYTSGRVSKLEFARSLAAAMAYLCFRQRDAAGLIVFSDQIKAHLPARYRQTHLLHILRTLVETRAESGTDANKALGQLALGLRSRSFVIFISDLLDEEDETIRLLQQMRSAGHEVMVFHVMDHAELTFPFEESAEFVDMESRQSVLASPRALRKEYMDALNAYLEQCRSQCQRHGVDYCLLDSSEALDKALFSYLNRRTRRF